MPASCSSFFSEWKISEPIRIASLNDGAPSGASMYSCMSAESVACLPPLRTFISGTGSVRASGPPR